MKSEVLPLTVSLLHYYDKALEIWASMSVGKNENDVFMWARYHQQPTNRGSLTLSLGNLLMNRDSDEQRQRMIEVISG
uniref:Uncharacterized protein n=1 Tax=Cucumis melo TaxID=3656 RepID=A0A9I9EDD7_CUCME